MRRGYSIIELLAVVTLLGLATLIAVPRLAAISDDMAVRQEAARLVAAFDAARGTARRLDAPAALALTDSSFVIECTLDSVPVVEWHAIGPAAQGVRIDGAGAPIAFSPDGVAMGVANRTITLSRGNASHRVVISRLGRITR